MMPLRNFVYGVFSKIAARFAELEKYNARFMLHFPIIISKKNILNFSFILRIYFSFFSFLNKTNEHYSKISNRIKSRNAKVYDLFPSRSKKYTERNMGRIIRTDRHRKETKGVTRSDADGREIKRINLSVDGRKTCEVDGGGFN